MSEGRPALISKPRPIKGGASCRDTATPWRSVWSDAKSAAVITHKSSGAFNSPLSRWHHSVAPSRSARIDVFLCLRTECHITHRHDAMVLCTSVCLMRLHSCQKKQYRAFLPAHLACFPQRQPMGTCPRANAPPLGSGTCRSTTRSSS